MGAYQIAEEGRRMNRSIYIGYDPREHVEFEVAASTASQFSTDVDIEPIHLPALQDAGLYTRRIERRGAQLFDPISNAPMATEFAISRFLTPLLARTGWALFMDSDVLVRGSLDDLFDHADDRYAVMCVKHSHNPVGTVKMDGQAQTSYARKNWSSVMLFNCQHSANAGLTVDLINTVPGRDLHRFCWLADNEIGGLGAQWNFLVGHSPQHINPRIVHFTDGTPLMSGYESQTYADEWRAAAAMRDPWTFSPNFAKSGTRSPQRARPSPSPFPM